MSFQNFQGLRIMWITMFSHDYIVAAVKHSNSHHSQPIPDKIETLFCSWESMYKHH